MRRGARRLLGFTTTVPFFSVLLPRMLMDDMGDDEEEGLREALPWYAKRNTIYYVGEGEKMTQWNLTFFNPFAVIADPFGRGIDDLMRGKGIDTAMWTTIRGILTPYVGEQILAGAINQVINNRDPFGNKIRTYVGDEWGSENIGHAISHVLKAAYGPRTPMKIMEAIKAAQDGTVKEGYRWTDIITGEFQFVKPKPVDLGKEFQKVMWKHTEKYRTLNFRDLDNPRAMNEGDVRKLYDQVFLGRKFLNEQLMRHIRGYESLGLSHKEIKSTLRDRGVSKDREKGARFGQMYRPVVPLDIKKKMWADGQEIRLKYLEDYQEELGHMHKLIPLDDD